MVVTGPTMLIRGLNPALFAKIALRQGRIHDFHFSGGGGGKRLCALTHTYHKRRSPKLFMGGVQGPLKVLGRSIVFWCSLVLSEPYFLSILIQNGTPPPPPRHSRSELGGRLLRLLWIHHCTRFYETARRGCMIRELSQGDAASCATQEATIATLTVLHSSARCALQALSRMSDAAQPCIVRVHKSCNA